VFGFNAYRCKDEYECDQWRRAVLAGEITKCYEWDFVKKKLALTTPTKPR
jgi:hypothetical protein